MVLPLGMITMVSAALPLVIVTTPDESDTVSACAASLDGAPAAKSASLPHASESAAIASKSESNDFRACIRVSLVKTRMCRRTARTLKSPKRGRPLRVRAQVHRARAFDQEVRAALSVDAHEPAHEHLALIERGGKALTI